MVSVLITGVNTTISPNAWSSVE